MGLFYSLTVGFLQNQLFPAAAALSPGRWITWSFWTEFLSVKKIQNIKYLFILGFRALDALFNFLMVWYYCTLTIRESILISNGSRSATNLPSSLFLLFYFRWVPITISNTNLTHGTDVDCVPLLCTDLPYVYSRQLLARSINKRTTASSLLRSTQEYISTNDIGLIWLSEREISRGKMLVHRFCSRVHFLSSVCFQDQRMVGSPSLCVGLPVRSHAHLVSDVIHVLRCHDTGTKYSNDIFELYDFQLKCHEVTGLSSALTRCVCWQAWRRPLPDV